MKVFHVTTPEEARGLNAWFDQGHAAFVLVYMEGCGPCNATRPEWKKMEQSVHTHFPEESRVAIADVNKDMLPHVPKITGVSGFPSLQFIHSSRPAEHYEHSHVQHKNRSADSFVEWVESKLAPVESVSSSNNSSKNNSSKNNSSSPHLLLKRLKRDTFGTLRPSRTRPRQRPRPRPRPRTRQQRRTRRSTTRKKRV